jgi:hypothetical protein
MIQTSRLRPSTEKAIFHGKIQGRRQGSKIRHPGITPNSEVAWPLDPFIMARI